MTIQNKNIIKISDEYGVEQEIHGITDYPISFDESTCSDEYSEVSGEQIEWLLHRVSKTKEVSKKLKSKSSRCKDTIDWVEVEYGDEYKKVKESPQSGKQSISSTLVKQLTKSEIESLRQNKRDAYALMMKMN